jgi:hypothetical protein
VKQRKLKIRRQYWAWKEKTAVLKRKIRKTPTVKAIKGLPFQNN